MAEISKAQYARVAKMLSLGVAESDVAEVVGVTPAAISQLKTRADFAEVFSAEMSRVYEEQRELNEGWDSIEKKALRVIDDNLKWNKNPDFALRAAMVANKANRRGSQNQPIDVGRMGSRAVVQLNVAFVNKLQGHGHISHAAANLADGNGNSITTPAMGAVTAASATTATALLAAPETSDETAPRQRVNMLAPGQVEQLFGRLTPAGGDELHEFLTDVDFAEAVGQ
jgi:hypothetical protein